MTQTKNWKEAFCDYRFKRMEIDRLQSKDYTVSDIVHGSSVDLPYTLHTVKVKGVDTKKAKSAREKIELLEAECAEVEAAIALAPNSQIRMILNMRYVDGASWAGIGQALGISDNACRASAKRYLNSL